MTLTMFAVAVVGMLFASSMGIGLCREGEEDTGLCCAGSTLGLQIILVIVFRSVWERNPYLCLGAAMFHQYLCFLPVMMAYQRESTGGKLYSAIVASVISGIFTLATWLFMVDQASRSHF